MIFLIRFINSFLFETKKILSTIYILIRIVQQGNFNSMKGFQKDVPKNEQAILFGNGPSANNDIKRILDDKDALTNTSIWVVNFFAFSEYFSVLKPQHYVLVDPGFWKLSLNEDKMSRLINILSQVKWNMTIYIPYTARKKNGLVETIESFKYINILYFNNIPLNKIYNPFKYSLIEKGLGNLGATNVIVTALFLSVFTKHKKIFIYGLEQSRINNIFLEDNMKWYFRDNHCYDEKETVYSLEDIVKSSNKESSFIILLKSTLRLYGQLTEVYTYAQSKGIYIYNDTPNTFIDIFPRSKNYNIINND